VQTKVKCIIKKGQLGETFEKKLLELVASVDIER
jgi:hypothetical protein